MPREKAGKQAHVVDVLHEGGDVHGENLLAEPVCDGMGGEVFPVPGGPLKSRKDPRP